MLGCFHTSANAAIGIICNIYYDEQIKNKQ